MSRSRASPSLLAWGMICLNGVGTNDGHLKFMAAASLCPSGHSDCSTNSLSNTAVVQVFIIMYVSITVD